MPFDLAALLGAGQSNDAPPDAGTVAPQDPSQLAGVLNPPSGGPIDQLGKAPDEVAQDVAAKTAPTRPIQAMLTNTLSMMAREFQPIQAPKPSFKQGVADAAASYAGIKTPFQNQVAARDSNMESLKTLVGANAIDFNQSRAQQTVRIGDMDMPLDVAKVYFPNYFKGVAEQGKNDRNAANIQSHEKIAGGRDATRRLLAGYNPDGSLNPQGIQKMSLGQSTILLRDAQRELAQAKASAEPERLRIAEANLGLAQSNLGMRQQEFQQKLSGMSPAGAKVMMDIAPAKAQIEELLEKLDPIKDNNQPGYFAADRLKYTFGMDSDGGDMEKSISQLELNRILAGTRLLKGGSRAYQALKLAMVHAPQTWKDSPRLMHNKLSTILDSLNQMEDAAQQYGGYQGNARPGVTQPPAGGAPKVGDIKKFPNGKTGKWDGTGWVAQ